MAKQEVYHAVNALESHENHTQKKRDVQPFSLATSQNYWYRICLLQKNNKNKEQFVFTSCHRCKLFSFPSRVFIPVCTLSGPVQLCFRQIICQRGSYFWCTRRIRCQSSSVFDCNEECLVTRLGLRVVAFRKKKFLPLRNGFHAQVFSKHIQIKL